MSTSYLRHCDCCGLEKYGCIDTIICGLDTTACPDCRGEPTETEREMSERLISEFGWGKAYHAFLQLHYGTTPLLLSLLNDEAIESLRKQVVSNHERAQRLEDSDPANDRGCDEYHHGRE